MLKSIRPEKSKLSSWDWYVETEISVIIEEDRKINVM